MQLLRDLRPAMPGARYSQRESPDNPHRQVHLLHEMYRRVSPESEGNTSGRLGAIHTGFQREVQCEERARTIYLTG